MTDDDLRALRLAELRRRRSSTSPGAAGGGIAAESMVESVGTGAGTAEYGVATGSKIVATAIGFTTMLGLVASMGIANRTTDSEAPSESLPVVPTQVLVDPPAGPLSEETSASADPASATTNEPIVLTAQPVVRQAPTSQAPSGRTNGSR